MPFKLKRKFPFIEYRVAQLKSIIAESGKLLWGGEPTFEPKNVDTYYKYFENDGTVQRSITDLAEQAWGQGFFTTVDEDQKAKDLCDEFCQKMNLDALLPNIAKNMLIAGFLPVETKINALPSKCVLKIVHPKTISNIILDPKTAEINFIHQKGRKLSLRPIKILERDLSWFVYNKIGNDPRGSSLLKGIVAILGYQSNAIKNMDKILARHASPLGIWKSKRAIDAIRKVVTEAEAGEDLFLGNLTDEEIKDLVQFIQLDPRARFWEYNEYLDRKIYENLGAPSLGYWRNATEASANKLDDIVLRNIYALQRNVKRIVEAKWFAPLCEKNNCTEVPKLEAGLEKTGVEELDISTFITKGLEIGYISLTQFTKLLQQMGLRIEEEEEGEVSGAAQPPEETPEEGEEEETLKAEKLKLYRKMLEKLG